MTNAEAIDAVVAMVPNWYYAPRGGSSYDLTVGAITRTFRSRRALTPKLNEFYDTVVEELAGVLHSVRPFGDAVALEMLQQHFALAWLQARNANISWSNLLNWDRHLSYRTYENAAIQFNLLIREAETGTHSIFDPAIERIIDPLVSSNWVYFVVDRDFNYVRYDAVTWDQVNDPPDYKYHPEFLHPYWSLLPLQGEEYTAHKTQRGDLIILNRMGLVAARRKGRWYLYDPPTLKNAFTDFMASYWVGANIFEILFDLSFRRHGALLIFDPERRVLNHVVNGESILAGGAPDAARLMLGPDVSTIRMGANTRNLRDKALLMEIASVDGAVLFTENEITAFGAMVETHAAAGGLAGARSTAALSALHWGGRPVKVSSDGEMSFYFMVDGVPTRLDLS